MDINQMRNENNKQVSQTLAMVGAGLKNGFQYITRFPGNILKNRRELKENNEEYKMSDLFVKAHESTVDTLDFESDYDQIYEKTLSFLEKSDKANKVALKNHGIDEDEIITGIKHFSTQIRYSRVGVTVENSIRRLAEKVDKKLDKIIDDFENKTGENKNTYDSKQKLSEFDEYLKQGVPTQAEQRDFSKKYNESDKTNKQIIEQDFTL